MFREKGSSSNEITHFKVKGLRGHYQNSSQIVPFYYIPYKQCRCTVVFSKVLSNPFIFSNFMKYYFITWWTFYSECWCNGLLKCPFHISKIIFGYRYTLIYTTCVVDLGLHQTDFDFRKQKILNYVTVIRFKIRFNLPFILGRYIRPGRFKL